MKKNKRILISLLLVIVMLTLTSSPVLSADVKEEPAAVTGQNAQLLESEVPVLLTYNHAQSSGHVSRLRDEEDSLDSAIFLNSDGSKSLYVFSEQIKYVDESGIIKDRCASLLQNRSGFESADNIFKIFYDNDPQNGININYSNHNITITPQFNEKTSAYKVTSNEKKTSIAYSSNSNNDMKIEYFQNLNGYGERFTFNEMPKNNLSFLVVSDSATLRNSEKGSVVVIDSVSGEEIMEYRPFELIDNDGRTYMCAVTVANTSQRGKYYINVDSLNETQINELTYPVRYQSSVTIGGSASSIDDATLYNEYNTNFGTWISLFVGDYDKWRSSSSSSVANRGIARTLIRFPGLLSNSTFNSVVENGKLKNVIFDYCDLTSNGTAEESDIYGYKKNYSWDENTIIYNQYSWAYESANYEGYTHFIPTDPHPIPHPRLQMDITSAAVNWKKNVDSATSTSERETKMRFQTLLLKLNDESKSAVVIGSSESGDSSGRTDSKPFVVVNYTDDMDGLIYNIQNKGTGKYLTVDNGYTYDGTNISVSNVNNNNKAAQEFRLEKSTNGYHIYPVCVTMGRYTVLDRKKANNNVQLYRPVDAASQYFDIVSVGNGYYKLVLRSDSTLAVTAVSSSGNVVMSTYTGADNQKWKFIYSETNIIYNYYANMNVQYPIATYRVTSGYGYRDVSNGSNPHCAIDISDDNINGQNIYSLFKGKVIQKKYDSSGGGNMIIVEASEDRYNTYGSNKKLQFVCMHMKDPSSLNVNSVVYETTVIGQVGNTGGNYSPHLHLAIIIYGSPTANELSTTINPLMLFRDENMTFDITRDK